MKIVHLARLYAPHLGGVETHVAEINKLLLAESHKVMVLTEQYDRDLPLTEIIDGVEVRRLPYAATGNKVETWRWVNQQIDALRSADVVQVHDIFWWLVPVYPLIASKIHTTFHGWETQWPIRWQAKLQRRVYSLLSRSVIHVGGWIEEFYGDHPDAVIYGGVNATSKISVPKNKIAHFLFLGRLDADTDVPTVIKIIKELQQTYKLTMTWVGDGELRVEAEKVGKVVGFQKKLESYLAQADFVFATSYLSMLKAQSLGKIVIAPYSNRLKQKYITSFTGTKFVISGKSTPEITKPVTELLENPKQKRELEQQAAEWAATQTWSKVLETYKKLWHKK